METFDYVIIGAGSAGSVLANRLGEDLGTKICVLEAGPSDWHPYIHLPAGFIKTFHMKSINWAYQQEVGPWTGGRSIYAPRGKTLGGSSSINGHIYNRGQRQDFDTWAQMGNRGWGYPDVLPYFKRMERRIGEADATYRGSEGPLTVSTMDTVMRSASSRCLGLVTTMSAGSRCENVPTSRAVPQAEGWPVSENGLLPGVAILPVSRWML